MDHALGDMLAAYLRQIRIASIYHDPAYFNHFRAILSNVDSMLIASCGNMHDAELVILLRWRWRQAIVTLSGLHRTRLDGVATLVWTRRSALRLWCRVRWARVGVILCGCCHFFWIFALNQDARNAPTPWTARAGRLMSGRTLRVVDSTRGTMEPYSSRVDVLGHKCTLRTR